MRAPDVSRRDDAMNDLEPIADPVRIRHADGRLLGQALIESRARTLRTFDAYEHALAAARMAVPYSAQRNPPLWEAGHVAWFQEFWMARNPQRALAEGADPEAPRPPSLLPDADAWYDSSRVEHAVRWHLPLPDAAGTRDYLARSLEETLRILASGATGSQRDRGDAYFAWLALSHEDMHHEAAQTMANGLAIPLDAARPGRRGAGQDQAGHVAELHFDAGEFELGSSGSGRAFDNELAPIRVRVAAFRIDAQPVCNGNFAAFVAAGGYGKRALWTPEGWAWREQEGLRMPRYWREQGSRWQQRWFGGWEDVDERAPASNLSWHEAQAWCAWAGRRLPAEAEWERAATAGNGAFRWGEVWEWTASLFLPYPRFVAHPYRDYSRPWFGSRRVLRGGSFATHPRMRHPKYRNFFTPERNDIFAGFRTCRTDGA